MVSIVSVYKGAQSMQKFLTFKEIKNNYSNIKYKATTDGKWYFLKDIYPLCIAIEGDPISVCLDTGGSMDTCDFGVFKFTNNELYKAGHKLTDIKI